MLLVLPDWEIVRIDVADDGGQPGRVPAYLRPAFPEREFTARRLTVSCQSAMIALRLR
jgi:hypothetical protein